MNAKEAREKLKINNRDKQNNELVIIYEKITEAVNFGWPNSYSLL